MAKLPQNKKFDLSRVKDNNELRLLGGLYNQFVQDVVNSLDARLTFADNLAASTYKVLLNGTFPVTVAWNKRERPTGLWPINLTRVDLAPTGLSAGYVLEWEYANGVISIIDTPGLTPSTSNQYNLTFIAIVG